MVDVTIFSAAGCGGCVSTKYQMKKRGIDFHEVRVDRDPVALEYFRAAGFSSVPVVMAFRNGDDELPDIWSGFHTDFVSRLLDDSLEIPDLYQDAL